MEINTGQAAGLDNTVKSLVLCLLEDMGEKKLSVYGSKIVLASQLKPAAVLDYNKNKAGVDRHDQMTSFITP